jgi:hypothetical protein
MMHDKEKTFEFVVVPSPQPIHKIKSISGEKLPLSTEGIEFSYNFWMFGRDVGQNCGKPKNLFFIEVRKTRVIFHIMQYQVYGFIPPKESKLLMIQLSTLLIRTTGYGLAS